MTKDECKLDKRDPTLWEDLVKRIMREVTDPRKPFPEHRDNFPENRENLYGDIERVIRKFVDERIVMCFYTIRGEK
jgi:hypothetical protein